MTIQNAIKKYNLKRQYIDCFGYKIKDGYTIYHAEKETEKAKYVYHLDNEISVDLGDGKDFILTIERFNKNKTDKNGFMYCQRKIIEIGE